VASIRIFEEEIKKLKQQRWMLIALAAAFAAAAAIELAIRLLR
jgi:hypothetical protein